MNPTEISFLIIYYTLKGAEATCVNSVNEMKKSFRLKGMLDFNVL